MVVLLPPEPVIFRIWALKQEVHRLIDSRNAVRLSPHITLLLSWFALTNAKEVYAAALTAFAATKANCPIARESFTWFGDQTLFVRVRGAEALQGL